MSKRKTAQFSWLLKMALRDGRSSGPKLLLFMASIVLGIAAVVAIQSFGENLKENISQQSREMMGADYIIDSDNPPNEKVQGIIDSLGGPAAQEINFASMVAFESGGTKLARVKGIKGDWPIYGTVETDPAEAAQSFLDKGGALVDATLMLQFNLKPGDSIKVGRIKLPITGKLISVPGRSAIATSVAPPVFIPYRFLEETGLIQTGSRVEYEYYFRAEPGMSMHKLSKELDPVLDAEGADLDTHSSTSDRIGDNYQTFGSFLNLVAFIALLLGCVGIASSINIYIRGKLRSVAVLRCVGATRRQTFIIYLIQVAGMGLLGGILGSFLGIVMQHLFPILVREFLPVEVAIKLSWPSIFMGILLGVVMSVMFAMIPLLGIWYVSPLQALRISDEEPAASRRARFIVLGGILVFIFIFSLWLLEEWVYALSFVGGLVVSFAILAGVAVMLMRLIKRFFPTSLGFVARQSLLNLFRPHNQTLTLVLTIGMGAFLLSTLYFTRDYLLEKVDFGGNESAANMILLDVQSGQKQAVAKTLRANELPVKEQIPIVTMKVKGIKGVSARELEKDTASELNDWVLHHEFRVTYRDSLIGSEVIASGDWVPEASADERPIPVSVSESFAEDALVEVGDALTFDVQGVRMKVRVASIRKVDWTRMQMNFSLVFPKGVLEDAPQFHVITTSVPDASASAQIQQELVRKFPNVSIFDLRQMLTMVEDILNKISWVISFMAFFSILTGIIVLIGAVRTSKYQRIRESVLLRTIGARAKQILRITALEYFYLGILGTLTGLLLGVVSSGLLAWLVFDAVFAPSLLPFIVMIPGITALVVIIGLSNSQAVIKSPPLKVLRKEGD